ncbi:hypothetical protein VC83_00526 [Pseudogymnoascus destructans]|uniref:Uncharacterized protein n=2 Tax=Pseudogymnoascus destructans TaxID=655981 RepID=L8GB39_PSED2|nr:uncharacterized protein VC83_00526 [Pseudogymnoascus destructans]ELR10435.1 hypothetical protein GMDG_00847 [Pseudogymnoascus destructans 20631-21]OAF62881.1 hypothetical protein VC83_00526 [Pseudogymnoascus destructans]
MDVMQNKLSNPHGLGQQRSSSNQTRLFNLMSHLANALRQITKKSSKIQTPSSTSCSFSFSARNKSILCSDSETFSAFSLSGDPSATAPSMPLPNCSTALDREQQSGPEAAEGSNEGIKCREADGQPPRAHRGDAHAEGPKEGSLWHESQDGVSSRGREDDCMSRIVLSLCL